MFLLFHNFVIICTAFTATLTLISFLKKTASPVSAYDIIPYHANRDDWPFAIPYRYCILFLILIGAFLRLWKLSEFPAGFHVDEAGMAYDAYCLANYGTDRFLNRYPVYLTNYGGGQSAGYAYLCMLLFRLFGYNMTTMRLPAAIAGIGVILLGSLITYRLFGQRISFLTTFLITICPYFITASRVALDCDLLLFFSMLAFYLLITALENQKTFFFFLTGVAYGLCLYTYSLSWIILPVFLALLTSYLMSKKYMTVKQLIALGIPVFWAAVPLILFVMINSLQLPEIVTPFFTIPRLPFYRASELKASNLYYMVRNIWYVITTDKTNIFSYDCYYTLFMMSIPFIIYGFLLIRRHCSISIEQGRNEYINYFFLFFLSALLSTAIQEAPNLYRSNALYFSLALFTAVAILSVCHYFKHSRVFLCLILGMYTLQALHFCQYYYSDKIQEENPIVWFTYDYLDDIYHYLHDHGIDKEIYIDDYNLTTYCYAMLEYEISPYDLEAEGNNAETYDFNYKNLHFYLPDEEGYIDPADIDPNAIYIVMDYNEAAIAALNQSSLCQTHYGYYTIYDNP